VFYFEQLLQQGIGGIDRTAMLPALVGIGYSILLISFLIGLYQSAMRGGDLQAFAISAIKYLVVAIILANWSSVFRDVNGCFSQIAESIGNSSGAGDMFLSWMDQLKDQFYTNGFSALLASISANLAAITTALLCFAAYLIYAVVIVVFAFFYVLYGCLLYVLGPIVLALLPMAGIGQLARSYATNLMIWNAWGVLYATFGALITAIQFSRIDQVMNQGFLIGFFQGGTDAVVLGLVSVFYALAIGLIPFIASRMIGGDLGSSAYALVRAGASAAGHVACIASGFGMGVGGFAAGSSLGGSATNAAGAAVATSSSLPPPAPPSFAASIRGGLMSAVSGGSAPPSGYQRDSRSEVGVAQPGAGFSRAPASFAAFRPRGVSQAIAFEAARLIGATASAGVSGSHRSRAGRT